MASVEQHQQWDRVFVAGLCDYEQPDDIDEAAAAADLAVPSVPRARSRRRLKRYPWWRHAYGGKKRGG